MMLATLLGVVAAVLELYAFLWASPRVSVVPGISSPINFEVSNESYIDLYNVRATCQFGTVKFSGGEILQNVAMTGLGDLQTPRIAAGSEKITSCNIAGKRRVLQARNLQFEISFYYRCVPFLAICRRSLRYNFYLVGNTWVEGEPFQASPAS